LFFINRASIVTHQLNKAEVDMINSHLNKEFPPEFKLSKISTGGRCQDGLGDRDQGHRSSLLGAVQLKLVDSVNSLGELAPEGGMIYYY
jgi:hypothetical protein